MCALDYDIWDDIDEEKVWDYFGGKGKVRKVKWEGDSILIRKLPKAKKWMIYSDKKDPKTGKRKVLGGPYNSLKEAQERLREIEFFKRKGKK